MASHAVLKEQLIEMGFEEKLIRGALSLLKDKATLESVIESIENGTAEIQATKLEQQPADDKDKENEANKEVTPEEFEARKKQIEEKIKQRRLEVQEKEKEAEKQREIQRRKDGQNMGKMREELEKVQRLKIAEDLKREKEAAKAQKDAVLRQIEQDRAERKAKATGQNATSTIAPTITPVNHTVSKDGKTKLAIRLVDGTSMIQEFDAKEVLSAVRAYIITNKNIDYNITLAMPPLPAFKEEDYVKPLHALGLVPNARLNVVRINRPS